MTNIRAEVVSVLVVTVALFVAIAIFSDRTTQDFIVAAVVSGAVALGTVWKVMRQRGRPAH